MTSNGLHRYVSDEVLDARYFKALDRFDVRFAPAMWVYDNVRAGSRVLHLACGAGMLALLKRKNINLTGVDCYRESAETARRNGYDATYQSDLTALPFADGAFDYVVGFDVLNQMSAPEEEAVLTETKRVLRSDGINMHSIQCSETVTDKDQATRFLEVFPHVAMEPRHALCMSARDFLDQDEATPPKIEADFLDYLRGLSFKERRAFDLAMGYVFSKISDLEVRLTSGSPRILVKASESPLGSFYNEHRDRRALFATNRHGRTAGGICLDRDGNAVFDNGWFEPAILPPVARWMGKQARLRFEADGLSEISFDLKTEIPDLKERPLGLEVSLNGVSLCAMSLYKYGWLRVSMLVPEKTSLSAKGEFELELRADRTAVRPPDDRELSLAVCNIEIRNQTQRPPEHSAELPTSDL